MTMLRLVALALLAGCTLPPPAPTAADAELLEWRIKVANAVNEHEDRLKALEAAVYMLHHTAPAPKGP